MTKTLATEVYPKNWPLSHCSKEACGVPSFCPKTSCRHRYIGFVGLSR